MKRASLELRDYLDPMLDAVVQIQSYTHEKTVATFHAERLLQDAVIADDASKKTLHGIAKQYILPELTVYRDEWGGYAGLENINGYQHRRVNHSAGVYVVGTTHTQAIEGFWSACKARDRRGLSLGKQEISSNLLRRIQLPVQPPERESADAYFALGSGCDKGGIASGSHL